MAALIRATLAKDLSTITIPALALFSPQDQIVDPAATEDVMARWGGLTKTLLVPSSGDPENHVIAGDILSPGTTEALADQITGWIISQPSP